MSNIFVLGASGFVGSNLLPALKANGHNVICGSRHPEKYRSRFPGYRWVKADVGCADTLDDAFEGVDTIVYLVHQMRSGCSNLVQQESTSARRVSEAAHARGVKHIVYLGGPGSTRDVSPHLMARNLTGQVLRTSKVPTTELKAGMIIGHGSESWLIVRDLVARLPYMILPAWLKTTSHPIAIDDVVFALAHVAGKQPKKSQSYQLSGPEELSGADILQRVGAILGWQPRVINLPYLTPRLSSHWIRLVTRADMRIAKELVEGLTCNLTMDEPVLWATIDGYHLTNFDQAVRRALDAEYSTEMSNFERFWEQSIHRLAPLLNFRIGESTNVSRAAGVQHELT